MFETVEITNRQNKQTWSAKIGVQIKHNHHKKQKKD